MSKNLLMKKLVKEKRAMTENNDVKKDAVDSIEKTVEDLKKKIEEISNEEQVVVENKDVEVNDANKAQNEFKEKAIEQINRLNDKVKNDEELKEYAKKIQTIALEAVENLKKYYEQFINDPKVAQTYADAKERFTEAYEKLEDFTGVQINKLKENEDFMNVVNNVNESVNKGLDKLNEFTSRPDVQKKIDKAKDQAINLAEKSTEALKKWLKNDKKESDND